MNMKKITSVMLALYLMTMAGKAAAEGVCVAMENFTGLGLIIACKWRAVQVTAPGKSKYCVCDQPPKFIMDADSARLLHVKSKPAQHALI
jgi:hypothetical protein